MSNQKNQEVSSAENNDINIDKKTSDSPLPFHNPLQAGDGKQITQEDIENEQNIKKLYQKEIKILTL